MLFVRQRRQKRSRGKLKRLHGSSHLRFEDSVVQEENLAVGHGLFDKLHQLEPKRSIRRHGQHGRIHLVVQQRHSSMEQAAGQNTHDTEHNGDLHATLAEKCGRLGCGL